MEDFEVIRQFLIVIGGLMLLGMGFLAILYNRERKKKIEKLSEEKRKELKKIALTDMWELALVIIGVAGIGLFLNLTTPKEKRENVGIFRPMHPSDSDYSDFSEMDDGEYEVIETMCPFLRINYHNQIHRIEIPPDQKCEKGIKKIKIENGALKFSEEGPAGTTKEIEGGGSLWGIH